MGARTLLSEAEPLNHLAVLVGVSALQVVKQLATLADHFQQPTSGMMILDVRLEMIGKPIDARRKQRDLYFRRTSVASNTLVLGYNLRFLRNGH